MIQLRIFDVKIIIYIMCILTDDKLVKVIVYSINTETNDELQSSLCFCLYLSIQSGQLNLED